MAIVTNRGNLQISQTYCALDSSSPGVSSPGLLPQDPLGFCHGAGERRWRCCGCRFWALCARAIDFAGRRNAGIGPHGNCSGHAGTPGPQALFSETAPWEFPWRLHHAGPQAVGGARNEARRMPQLRVVASAPSRSGNWMAASGIKLTCHGYRPGMLLAGVTRVRAGVTSGFPPFRSIPDRQDRLTLGTSPSLIRHTVSKRIQAGTGGGRNWLPEGPDLRRGMTAAPCSERDIPTKPDDGLQTRSVRALTNRPATGPQIEAAVAAERRRSASTLGCRSAACRRTGQDPRIAPGAQMDQWVTSHHGTVARLAPQVG